jgi:hypothetical protein
MGSTPYYVAAVSLYRMAERPFVLGGLGILWGYLKATLEGGKRMTDADYLAYVKRYERDALIFGKRRAAARYDDALRQRPPPSGGRASREPDRSD